MGPDLMIGPRPDFASLVLKDDPKNVRLWAIVYHDVGETLPLGRGNRQGRVELHHRLHLSINRRVVTQLSVLGAVRAAHFSLAAIARVGAIDLAVNVTTREQTKAA